MTLEKWQKLTKDEQILNIASELFRVKIWLSDKNEKQVLSCLDRAFELIDLTINDSYNKKELRELLRFREVLALFYVDGKKSFDEFLKIFKTLLALNPKSFLVKID